MTQAQRDALALYAVIEQAHPLWWRLLGAFPTPADALAASSDSWRRMGVPPAKLARFEEWKRGALTDASSQIDATLSWLEAPGRTMLEFDDPLYPPLLKTIADPPPLLFVRGDPAFLSQPQIGIVGTRHPSRVGAQIARDFSAELAGRGLVVTSGLALGIDGAAHQGALLAKGVTIAVLGTGPDRLYPRSHLRLAEDLLAAGGLVVSEFLPGTAALTFNFPRRNRIISGLSLGVLVVEAALQSGSLITARLAAEQGREVWAIPGSLHNAQSKGCHTLIREGAKLVDEVAHILEDIAPALSHLRAYHPPAAIAPAPLDRQQKRLLDTLGWERRSLDWLVDQTGIAAAEVSGLLMQLELDGRVAAVPGGYEQLPPPLA